MATRGGGGGAWLMAAAGALGLLVSTIAYFRRASGVDHTAGALLVVVSTLLLTGAAVALALTVGARGRWRWPLFVLALLDVLGTALAAYFLHAWLLLALMAVALAGWIIAVAPPARVGSGHARHLSPAP